MTSPISATGALPSVFAGGAHSVSKAGFSATLEATLAQLTSITPPSTSPLLPHQAVHPAHGKAVSPNDPGSDVRLASAGSL